MMKNIYLLLFCLFAISSTTLAKSIRLQPLHHDFVRPVELVFDYNNDMYVVEKRGTIIKIDNNGIRTTFLDISDRVNSAASEQGLLGMCFDPSFENNGRFFVFYIAENDDSVISRFSSNAGNGDPSSEEEIIRIPQPARNHNGGKITFGPDGYLYIGIGDGGGSGDPQNFAQNRNSLLGKLLRLDVSNLPYAIPNDNPFISDPNTLDEIWSLGLRNPWKYSFDAVTGDLYIADVGQGSFEEINLTDNATGGLNYGWRCYEGNANFNTSGCNDPSSYHFPIYTYVNSREGDGCSVTGGYVYHGDSLSFLQGHYIYGDFCSGKIWSLVKDQNDLWVNEEIYRMDRFEIATFGQDNHGEMYVASFGEGSIYQLATLCDTLTSLEANPSFCFSSDDGSITIDTPDPNYTYQINGGSLDNLHAGEYKVSITDSNGCLDVYRIEVPLVYEFPEIDIDLASVMMCKNDSISLSLPNLQLGIDIETHLYLDDVFVAVMTNPFILNKEGEYTIRLHNTSNDCTSQAFELIEVEGIDPPQVSLELSGGILEATPGFTTYLWYVDGVQFLTTSTNTIALPEETGSYTVTVLDSDCMSNPSNSIFISSTNDPNNPGNIQLYPNPNYGDFYLRGDLKNAANIHIEIYNSLGKMLVAKSIEDVIHLNHPFDISHLADGNYLLMVEINGQTTAFTFVKG